MFKIELYQAIQIWQICKTKTIFHFNSKILIILLKSSNGLFISNQINIAEILFGVIVTKIN